MAFVETLAGLFAKILKTACESYGRVLRHLFTELDEVWQVRRAPIIMRKRMHLT
jgi:hypothetical protein